MLHVLSLLVQASLAAAQFARWAIIPKLDFIHFKGCGAREPDIRRTVKTSHSASQSAKSCMSYWS